MVLVISWPISSKYHKNGCNIVGSVHKNVMIYVTFKLYRCDDAEKVQIETSPNVATALKAMGEDK